MIRRLTALSLLALPLAVACSQDTRSIAPDTDRVEATLKADTVVASRAEALAAVVGPSSVQFPASAEIVRKLKTGTVMVGEPAAANGAFLATNPDGFLRKVVSVKVNGNIATVETVQARIDEGFEHFVMSVTGATPNFNPGGGAIATKGGGGGAPPAGGGADPAAGAGGADPVVDPVQVDPAGDDQALDGAEGQEAPAVNEDPVAAPDGVGKDDGSQPPAADAPKDESKASYDGPTPPGAGNLFDWRIQNKQIYKKSFGAGNANGGAVGDVAIQVKHAWATASYKVDTKFDYTGSVWKGQIGTKYVDASLNARLDGSVGAVLQADVNLEASANGEAHAEFGKDGEAGQTVYESDTVPLAGFHLPILGNIVPKAKLEIRLVCNGDASGTATGYVGFSGQGFAELGLKYSNDQFSSRIGKGFNLTPYYQFDAKGRFDGRCDLVSTVRTSLWGGTYGNVDINGFAEAHANASTSGGAGKTTDSQVCGAFQAGLKGTADARLGVSLPIVGDKTLLDKHFELFDIKMSKSGKSCGDTATPSPCQDNGKAKADGYYCGQTSSGTSFVFQCTSGTRKALLQCASSKSCTAGASGTGKDLLEARTNLCK